MGMLLTTEQVAQRLGLKPNTLEKWRITGEGIPHIRVGRSIRYSSEDVDEWLASRRVQSTSAEL